MQPKPAEFGPSRPRELEALFVRFRERGDLTALALVFDRTAPKLLAVARHLAADEASAEDVVQATFLAALEHAERFDAERDLESWLVGIATNQAQKLRARQARTPDPVRLVLPEDGDPVERAELAEFVATLDATLARVPEAYRAVLREHLADGRSPEEIARKLARSPNTVRVQLHRGLKHLRRLLPAGFAVGGLALVARPRGLATVRELVLSRGAEFAPLTATGSGVGGTSGGGTMSSKLVLIVSVAALLGVAAWIGLRPSRGSVAPLVAQPALAEEVAQPAARAELAAPDVASRASNPDGSGPALLLGATGALTVEVAWSDGTPAAGVEVVASKSDGPKPRQVRYQRGDTGADGRWRTDHIEAGAVQVGVSGRKPGGTVVVVVGEERTLRLVLDRGVDVTGRVVDPAGAPVAGAVVFYGWPNWPRAMQTIGRAGADGRFAFRSLRPDIALAALTPQHSGSPEVWLRDAAAPAPELRTVELALRDGETALRGTVFGADGERVAGAWVRIASRDPERAWPSLWLECDEQGEFLAEGLRAGGVRLSTAPPEGPCTSQELTLQPGVLNTIELRLARGVTVRGRLTRADGAPALGASVQHDQSQSLFDDEVCYRFSRVDADGNYEVGPLPPGRFALVAELRDDAHELRTREGRWFEAVDGSELVWDVVLGEPHAIQGRVLDADGAPLAGWDVQAGALEGPGHSPKSARTDALGRFRISGCVVTQHTVWVYAPGPRIQARAEAVGVLPDQTDLELRVTPMTEPSSFVRGRVLNSNGTPATGVQVQLCTPERCVTTSESDVQDGTFRLGPVVAGTYELVAVLPDRNNHRVPGAIALAGNATHDAGDVRLPELGRFTLGVQRSDGVALDVPLLWLVDGDGRANLLEGEDVGPFASRRVPIGAYRLRGTFRNAHLPERDVEVRANEETHLDLVCEPATFGVLTFHLPEGALMPERLRAEIRSGASSMSTYYGPRMRAGDRWVLSMFLSLPAGTYTWSATAGTWEGNGSFAFGPDVQRIDVDLHAH
ncbi:MAG: sigma-70 family RNA polymerase sigma factor [Planctomycetes bacterium]|nr:sigma-70 family RNA polymerase sigma factor [Planctomycetota bacterium]